MSPFETTRRIGTLDAHCNVDGSASGAAELVGVVIVADIAHTATIMEIRARRTA
jgi:hypothetical protein